MQRRTGSTLPLVRPAVAVIIGIALGKVSGWSPPLVVPLGVFSVSLIFEVFRKPPESRFPFRSGLLFIAFALTGVWRYGSTDAPYLPIAEGRVTGEVVVLGAPRCSAYKCRVNVLANVADSIQVLRTCTLELVASPEKEAALIEGNRLWVSARCAPFKPPPNPHQYDPLERAHALNLSGQLLSDSMYVMTAHSMGWRLRGQRWLWTALAGISDTKVRGMCYALLTGDKSELDRELRSAFARCGTMHLLAVSGLHVGLVAWLPMLLMRTYRQRHWAAVLCTLVIIVVWGFAWFTGLSASVVRAAGMLSLMALGLLIRKRVSTLNALAAAAIFMLISDPELLFNAGFLLSFVAVAAIVSFTGVFRQRMPVTKRRWLNAVFDSSAVTLAAQAGTTPISLYFFRHMPLLFLPANLIAVPIGTLLLYLLMLHTLLIGLGVDLGILAWTITTVGRILIAVSEAIGSLEWSAIEGVALSGFGAFALAASTIVFVRILGSPIPRNWWPMLPMGIGVVTGLPKPHTDASELVLFSEPKGISIGIRDGQNAYIVTTEYSSDFASGGWSSKHDAIPIAMHSDTLTFVNGWPIERCNDRFGIGPFVLLPEKAVSDTSELGGWRLRRKWQTWLLIHPRKRKLEDWDWTQKALSVQLSSNAATD